MRESGLSGGLPGHERVRAGRSGGPRAVRAGEVILRSKAFAHVIDATYVSMYCDTCIVYLKDCLLHPCQECRVVWYCSKECEEEAQAWHRLECPALKRRLHNLPPDFVRLLARVILRLRNGGDKHVEKFTEREGRRFRDLMSHYQDIKRTEEKTQDAKFLREELGKFIGERLLPNMCDFMGIYGRILVNRFSLIDKVMLNIGSTVYLAASILDHDCSPNCSTAFSGRTVEIRSLFDMPSLDYNKCRIAYVDPVCTVTARRKDIYRKWFFWCECKTCNSKERKKFENSGICENRECLGPVSMLDPEDVATSGKAREENKKKVTKETSVDQTNTHTKARLQQKAQQQEDVMRNGKEDKRKKQERKPSMDQKSENGTKDATVNHKRGDGMNNGEEEDGSDDEDEEDEEEVTYGRCSACGREVSAERTRAYWDAAAFTREKLRNMTEENPEMESCLEMLERQEGLLFYLNAWRVRTLDFAFNAAMFNGGWSLALKYAEENENGMRFYYGAKHPAYGIFLYKLGKGKIYFKEFRKGVSLLDEAEAILTPALGDSHPLLEDLRLVNLTANEDIEICLERRIAAAMKREEKLKKKQEEKQEQNVLPLGDNFAPHKTFPWFSCEKDRITKPLTPLCQSTMERG